MSQRYKIGGRQVRCSEDAAAELRPAIPKRLLGLQECMVALYLTAKHQPIGKPVLLAMGSVDFVTIHPRDVFREAVRRNAVAVIVGHNHPSGNLELSQDDRALTNRLRQAGELLGIPLLDHLILARGSWVSLADRGQL
jgi:DNA repair protein RadC